MPCRPRLCQRLAAQLLHPPPTPFGSNHIWISDELLSEAFNRYVSVSHATRRYGSNVPGPLEARRRASKRRMGCAVAATSMGPPGGDFGALFGAGAGGKTIENRWTWKAAGAQPVVTEKNSNGWNWGANSSEPPAKMNMWERWDQHLEEPRSGEELVKESRLAFEELLQNAEDIEILEVADVSALIDFLASSADEPEAKNVSRLVLWLSGCSISDPAWQAITALICDKLKLASIDNEELHQVIRALPGVLEWEQDDSSRQRLHETYVAFAESLEGRALSGQSLLQAIFEEVHRTTQDARACSRLIAMLNKSTSDCDAQVLSNNVAFTLLAIHNSGAKDLTRTELLSDLETALSLVPSAVIPEVLRLATRAILDNGLSVWRSKSLRALAWLDCVSPATFTVDHMPIVYAEIAQRLPLYQIAEHFASKHIQSVDIARLLLRVWLPNAGFGNTLHSQFESSNAANSMRSLKTLQYGVRSPSIADLSVVAVEFEELCKAYPDDNVWSALLKAFKRKGVAYDYIVHQILHICKARYEPGTVYRIFMYMLKDCELALPKNVYVSLIEHFLANNENRLAFKIWRASPSIAVTDVPDLPVALLKDVSFRFSIFDMLLREPDTVPMELRDTHKLSVTPGHIEVVHIIAHNVASMDELRPSQAYRSVWALYRWLQDRGAPTKPLISRAIVTAGILRPIKEHIWIPDERLEYILSIVEKVEGVKIREEVEKLASYMRSSVHDQVIAKRRAKKESMWMKITRDMVGKSQFRLKRWTKQKPVPVGDGQTFVVPSEGISNRNFEQRLDSVDTESPTPSGGFARPDKINKTTWTPASAEYSPACEEVDAEAVLPKPARDFVALDDMLSTPVTTEYRRICEEPEAESVPPKPPTILAAPLSVEDMAEPQDVLASPAAQPVS
jgi:hypothetical protein